METVRIRDPGWEKVGSGIRDKPPGSATLIFSKYNYIILHFLVDLDNEEVSERQPAYSRHSNWTAEASFEFLEPRASHPFFRAFYVPLLSRRYCR